MAPRSSVEGTGMRRAYRARRRRIGENCGEPASAPCPSTRACGAAQDEGNSPRRSRTSRPTALVLSRREPASRRTRPPHGPPPRSPSPARGAGELQWGDAVAALEVAGQSALVVEARRRRDLGDRQAAAQEAAGVVEA